MSRPSVLRSVTPGDAAGSRLRNLPWIDCRNGDDDPHSYRKGDAFGEYAVFFGLGLDGLFSDQADTALQAREWWLADRAA